VLRRDPRRRARFPACCSLAARTRSAARRTPTGEQNDGFPRVESTAQASLVLIPDVLSIAIAEPTRWSIADSRVRRVTAVGGPVVINLGGTPITLPVGWASCCPGLLTLVARCDRAREPGTAWRSFRSTARILEPDPGWADSHRLRTGHASATAGTPASSSPSTEARRRRLPFAVSPRARASGGWQLLFVIGLLSTVRWIAAPAGGGAEIAEADARCGRGRDGRDGEHRRTAIAIAAASLAAHGRLAGGSSRPESSTSPRVVFDDAQLLPPPAGPDPLRAFGLGYDTTEPRFRAVQRSDLRHVRGESDRAELDSRHALLAPASSRHVPAHLASAPATLAGPPPGRRFAIQPDVLSRPITNRSCQPLSSCPRETANRKPAAAAAFGEGLLDAGFPRGRG